jgi:hypothetical protein
LPRIVVAPPLTAEMPPAPTGPVTPEGQRRVGLNPLRHGLTGQPSFCPMTISLPIKSTSPGSTPSSSLTASSKPKPSRPSPTPIGVSTASAPWKTVSSPWSFTSKETLCFGRPAIQSALAQAKALDGRGDLLARLSLYEQRLNRTLMLAKAELKKLQQERAEAEEQALEAAAKIRNLKQAPNQLWLRSQMALNFRMPN